MPRVVYIEDDGTHVEVDVEEGYSVMEGAIMNGVEGHRSRVRWRLLVCNLPLLRQGRVVGQTSRKWMSSRIPCWKRPPRGGSNSRLTWPDPGD